MLKIHGLHFDLDKTLAFLLAAELRQSGGDHHGEDGDDEGAVAPHRQEGRLAEAAEPLKVPPVHVASAAAAVALREVGLEDLITLTYLLCALT